MLPEIKTQYDPKWEKKSLDSVAQFEVPQTDLVRSFYGHSVEIPASSVADLVATVLSGVQGTVSWLLNAENSDYNWLKPGARIEAALALKAELEAFCDEVVAKEAIPNTRIQRGYFNLNKEGLNIVFVQALKNAGYSDETIQRLTSDTSLTTVSNRKFLWDRLEDSPHYDFSYLPNVLTEFAEIIADNLALEAKRDKTKDDLIKRDHSWDILSDEILGEVRIQNWDNPTESEWDQIFTYLIQKIRSKEIVFAKLPIEVDSEGEVKREMLTAAILIPSLKNLK